MNKLYEWEMSQNLSLGGLKWVEKKYLFNEAFIKSSNDDSDEG